MPNTYDIFADIGRNYLLSYIDKLAEPRTGRSDHFTNSELLFSRENARLRRELEFARSLNTRLIAERESNSATVATAQVVNDMVKADLNAEQEQSPENKQITSIKFLNDTVNQLAIKFYLSYKFYIFSGVRQQDIVSKNEIWRQYLAAIGVADMGEILKLLHLGKLTLRHIPDYMRPFYQIIHHFADYFQLIISCLDTVPEDEIKWHLLLQTKKDSKTHRDSNIVDIVRGYFGIHDNPEGSLQERFYKKWQLCKSKSLEVDGEISKRREMFKLLLAAVYSAIPDSDYKLAQSL